MAAERLLCPVNLQRTNTTRQWLALLNDTPCLEASAKLAERMISEGGAAAQDRITCAFRLLTSRRPDQKEGELLEKLYADLRREYGQDKAVFFFKQKTAYEMPK